MDSLLPFLQGSCIPYNMPVYPGALRFAPDPAGAIGTISENFGASPTSGSHYVENSLSLHVSRQALE